MSEIKNIGNQNKKIIWTILSIVFASLMLMFVFVMGSVTNNRFGLHLVFSSDLTSSPIWFISIISTIVIAAIIGSIVIGSLTYFKKINLSDSQQKIIRLGSFTVMGISFIAVALSSICFAAFNWQFFDSQLNDGLTYKSVGVFFNEEGSYYIGTGDVNVSNQALTISILTLLSIIATIGTTKYFVFTKKDINNKLYYSVRNASIASIALGWLVFNINIISFGYLGGDFLLLFDSLTGSSGQEILIQIGNKSPEEAWNMINSLVNNLGLHGPIANIFDSPWEEGPGHVIQNQFAEIWTNILGPMFIDLGENPAKEGLLGVNNSASAYMMFSLLVLLTLSLFGYVYVTYNYFEENSKSTLLNMSLILIVLLSILFAIMSWILPYVGIDIPGLIAPANDPGGIYCAFVYFLPGYDGTLAWLILFIFLILIVLFSILGALLKQQNFFKKNNK